MQGNPRMLTGFVIATAATVVLIAALATETWWALIPAVIGHGIATALIMGMLGKTLKSGDKPDPVTEAHLEADRDEAGEGDGGPKMAI